jgi:hypothetical protein
MVSSALPGRQSLDGRGHTNGGDVASDFVDLRFRFLGGEKAEVTLEALVCNRRSNECGVVAIC